MSDKLTVSRDRLDGNHALLDLRNDTYRTAHIACVSVVVRLDDATADDPVKVARMEKLVKAFNSYDAMVSALEQLAAIEKLAKHLPQEEAQLFAILRDSQIATKVLEEIDNDD